MLDTELDDVVASLRFGSVAEDWAALLAAQKAAQAAPPPPPSLIPMAVFPHEPGVGWCGVARWECQRKGCGWGVEMSVGTEPVGPLILPVDFTPADLSAAISAGAESRAAAQREALEHAFREHLREVHAEDPAGGAH
ncbi:hypothetical protein ACH4RG_22905 [Streptomyces sp. NPDC021019]|uniref:hypothetical protein n=1 Tax=Streptomyces sp. NPDC021019 TaxID=3365108 RepID=UPI0037ABD34B